MSSINKLLPLILSAAVSSTLAQQSSTLDKARASGSITVGYRESSIPFSYLAGEGKPTGFGWEICGKIVEQVKKATSRSDLQIAAQAVTSQNRIPLMSKELRDNLKALSDIPAV